MNHRATDPDGKPLKPGAFYWAIPAKIQTPMRAG